jgi:hypothetical protein
MLLGHSTSGLLIEQALINTCAKDATTGLAFFATPHRGDKILVSIGMVVAKIAINPSFQRAEMYLRH